MVDAWLVESGSDDSDTYADLEQFIVGDDEDVE